MHARHWIAATTPIALAALMIALAGCGPKPQASTPAPEDTAAGEPATPDADPAGDGEAGEVALAAPPFTPEQIREATAAGRTYRFAMRQGDQTVTVTMRFTAVTPEGATIERTVVDASGNTLDQGTEEATWAQLVDHASYPAEATVITDTTVEVPAGKFDAKLYTITAEQDGKPLVSRMYFAKSLPGAPVKAEIMLGDQPMFAMELVEHTPGQ